jgi:sulfate adenylyltransferase subunit 1 (EFTu-like GTPase family)
VRERLDHLHHTIQELEGQGIELDYALLYEIIEAEREKAFNEAN